MTLQEALESGRRFKRTGDNFYNYSTDCFQATDILATDWELEPLKKREKREISADDLEEAANKVNQTLKKQGVASRVSILALTELIKQLGLE